MTVDEVKNITLDELIGLGDFQCSCGKIHSPGVEKVIIDRGAVNAIPALLREIGAKKPFILSGHDTFAAAGEAVTGVLDKAEIPYSSYVFPVSPVRPTEFTVGSAFMHFDYSCDAIIAIGSGVINDTGKILAKATGLKYIVTATAPSMDGFVSATSSMDRDGHKVSLPSTAAWAVIGDLDILCRAPMHLLLAGVGDILAKLVSLREWRLARIILDEEYCEVIAALVEKALDKVISQTEGLLKREPEAVRSVIEGLIISGLAMNYAGVSRPASGTEHYFSHIWDMRSLAFEGARFELHGIQTGIGALYAIRAYEQLIRDEVVPCREKALDYVRGFSLEAWNEELRRFIGPGAEAMIDGERRERKYDLDRHAERLESIIRHWGEITDVIKTLPKASELEALMESIGFPTSAAVIGYGDEAVRTTFTMTKDIRDKYIGTRLFWDLGILDELADKVFLSK